MKAKADFTVWRHCIKIVLKKNMSESKKQSKNLVEILNRIVEESPSSINIGTLQKV